MRIHALADDTLFWPKNGAAPFWRLLDHLCVLFHMATPSSSWYFRGPDRTHEYSEEGEYEAGLYPPLEYTDTDEEI